jgi:hypothetical protein
VVKGAYAQEPPSAISRTGTSLCVNGAPVIRQYPPATNAEDAQRRFSASYSGLSTTPDIAAQFSIGEEIYYAGI